MKKWAVVVLLLYAAIILVFTLPVCILAFWGDMSKDVIKSREILNVFVNWPYWIGFACFLFAQAALLDIHVDISGKRPVTKKTIVPVVLFSALMMSLLVIGIILAINETIKKDSFPKSMQLYYLLLPLSWLIWGFIFYRWSSKLDTNSFLSRIRQTFFYGSILELLIAVPTHILARYRNYCCAGFSTFIGIVFGLALMLCSFGPGVFFLFVQRWKQLHPGRVS